MTSQLYATQPLSSSPIRRACGVAVVLSGLAAVANTAAAFGQVRERRIASQVLSLSLDGLTSASRAEHLVKVTDAVAGSLTLFAAIAVAVAFAVTTRWASRGGVPALRWGPGWAGWGWICPVMNLYVPKVVADDLLDGATWGDSPGRRTRTRLVRAWWGLFLLAVALGVAVLLDRLGTPPDTRARVHTTLHTLSAASRFANAAYDVLTVVLLARFVRRYDDRESRLAGAPSRWRDRPELSPVTAALVGASALLVVVGLVAAGAQTVTLPRFENAGDVTAGPRATVTPTAPTPAPRTGKAFVPATITAKRVTFTMVDTPEHTTMKLASPLGQATYNFWSTSLAEIGRGQTAFTIDYPKQLDVTGTENNIFATAAKQFGTSVRERHLGTDQGHPYVEGTIASTSGVDQQLRVVVVGDSANVFIAQTGGNFRNLVQSIAIR